MRAPRRYVQPNGLRIAAVALVITALIAGVAYASTSRTRCRMRTASTVTVVTVCTIQAEEQGDSPAR